MVPTPAILPSLSQPAPVASEEVPCDQLTEEEKTWAWFTNGSAGYAGTTEKWAAVYYSPFLGHSPRAVIKGDPLHGQNFTSGCSFCLEGEIGMMNDYIPTHGLWLIVWLDVRDLEGT